MKSFERYLYILLIAALIAIILVLLFKKNPKEIKYVETPAPCPELSTLNYKPIPVTRKSVRPGTPKKRGNQQPVIINDSTVTEYVDTIKSNYGFVVVSDVLKDNEIQNRKYKFELIPPKIIHHQVPAVQRTRWYVGTEIVATPSTLPYVGAALMVQPKHSRVLLNLGIGQHNNSVAGKLGVYVQLNKSR